MQAVLLDGLKRARGDSQPHKRVPFFPPQLPGLKIYQLKLTSVSVGLGDVVGLVATRTSNVASTLSHNQ